MTGTLAHTRANIRQRVDNYEDDRPFQHPARRAAMAARNAVAAEMAVAGRAGHTHLDPCWGEARTALLEPGDAAWVLASDAYSQMREDLNCLWPTPAEALGHHGSALSALATPVAGATGTHSPRASAAAADDARKPAARRRRERLETAFWFAVGGFGGLALACSVRVLEMVFMWR